MFGRFIIGGSATHAIVASIDKAYSDTLGGKTRRITGSGFALATAADVLFGGTPSSSITVVSDSIIDAVVPAHASGLVDISILGGILPNAIKFWDPSVPGTPTFCVDRGGFSQATYNGDVNSNHWVRRFGSYNVGGVSPLELRYDGNVGGRVSINVEGVPSFNQTVNGDSTAPGTLVARSSVSPPDNVNITIEDLFGGANQNLGGTVLCVGSIREIGAAPGSAIQGDGIYYDNGQNRNALLIDTTPRIFWMWWDGSFKRVATPINTSGQFAVAVVRDVTTAPGIPFMKITTDGITWSGTSGTTQVGSVTSSQQTAFGQGAIGSFRGINYMMAWYKIQLTAQDITDYYGWYDAEFSHSPFPATDDPRGWWKGSFSGSPWIPTASNGMSGSGLNLTTFLGGGMIAPGVGSAVNGFTPVTFNGTSQALQSTIYTRALIGNSISNNTNNNFTIIALAKVLGSPSAITTDYYTDAAIITDSGGNLGISSSSSGIRAGMYNGGSFQTTSIPIPVGQWFMAAMRYNTTQIKFRVNNTEALPVSASHTTFGDQLYFGTSYNNAKKWQGEGMQYIFFNRLLSDAEIDAYYVYFQTKYPAMNLPNQLMNADFSALSLGSYSATNMLNNYGITFVRSTVSTVQTSAATLDATPGVNAACIGSLNGTVRGLVIQHNTRNGLGSAGASRSLNSGWNAGTQTVTFPFADSPDTTVTGCSRTVGASGTFANYGDNSTASRIYFSSWQRSTNSASNGDMQQVWITAAPGDGIQAVRLASNIWARLGLANGTVTREYWDVCDCRDYTASGGQSARARDVLVDYVQRELGDFPTEAIVDGTAYRSNDRISYASGNGMVHNGVVKFYAKLYPKHASSMDVYYNGSSSFSGASAAWYLWSFNGTGTDFARIDASTKKLSVKLANGTTVTSTNAVSWSQYDLVEFDMEVGNGTTSVARYRVNGGAYQNLVLASVPGAAAPTGAFTFLASDIASVDTADSGHFPCWLSQIIMSP